MADKHNQLTDQLQETAALFAVGALPESERTAFVRHLEEDGCRVCQDEVRELKAAGDLLAFSLPVNQPSDKVHKRLMEQARAASAAPRRPRWSLWAAVISGLTAIAAASILGVVMNDNAELRRLANSLSARVSQLESQLTQQRVKYAMV